MVFKQQIKLNLKDCGRFRFAPATSTCSLLRKIAYSLLRKDNKVCGRFRFATATSLYSLLRKDRNGISTHGGYNIIATH